MANSFSHFNRQLIFQTNIHTYTPQMKKSNILHTNKKEKSNIRLCECHLWQLLYILQMFLSPSPKILFYFDMYVYAHCKDLLYTIFLWWRKTKRFSLPSIICTNRTVRFFKRSAEYMAYTKYREMKREKKIASIECAIPYEKDCITRQSIIFWSLWRYNLLSTTKRE